MKMDQIAYYCQSETVADMFKKQLNLQNEPWIEDTVIANSLVLSPRGMVAVSNQTAKLQFNYSTGIELEILRYLEGDHWHRLNHSYHMSINKPIISHIGIHLADDEPFPVMEASTLVQETHTVSHTSKYLTEPGSPGFGRRYHYRIFELASGTYIKYIRRINPQ